MTPRNPFPTVDIIIEMENGIVLIERKFEPHGWALPGGFVDYGESLEDAAVREAKEETSLDVKLKCQLKSYSNPKRDKRKHTIATVFIAEGEGELQAADDAKNAKIVSPTDWPDEMAFDHRAILEDYRNWREKGTWPSYDG